jgi:hypothetical protein
MKVKPGDRVFLQKTNSGISIQKTAFPPGTAGYIGSLKVDKDGNIRVSRNFQRKAGVRPAPSFAMELKGGTVVLTA